VVQELGRALELDADTSARLIALATTRTARPPGGSVSAGVHQLLDMWGSPAYVRDRRFDVPAANQRPRCAHPATTGPDMSVGPAARRLSGAGSWPNYQAEPGTSSADALARLL
jgi:hypothetical protein